jgi:hypothetical protein
VPIVRIVVPKNQLMLLAGIVWCTAGAMVALIGIPLDVRLAQDNAILVPLTALIFLVFYGLVFSRLVRKHTHRIRSHAEAELPVWLFFNRSSWIVMAVMMGGGMALRQAHVFSDEFVAFFYTGLGVALFLCGLRFVGVFARKDVLVPVEADPAR